LYRRASDQDQNQQCPQAEDTDLSETIVFKNGLSLVPVTGDNVLVFIIQVKKLAEYEKLLDIVEMNEELVRKVFLSEGTNVKGYVAYFEGKAIGFTIYFITSLHLNAEKVFILRISILIRSTEGKGLVKQS
jgi:hypothetical protein